MTYTTQTIKGLEYAFFTAAAGTYAARYGTAAAASPAITAVSAATTEAGTPALTWDTSQPATTEISWSKGTDALDQKIVIAESARKHRLELPQLEAGATYRYRVRSRNQFGRDTAYPAPDRPAGHVHGARPAHASPQASRASAPSRCRMAPHPCNGARVAGRTAASSTATRRPPWTTSTVTPTPPPLTRSIWAGSGRGSATTTA